MRRIAGGGNPPPTRPEPNDHQPSRTMPGLIVKIRAASAGWTRAVAILPD
jgi:hypothetical protein